MSRAISARYLVVCPTCGAGSKEPCRTQTTKRVTDAHKARINRWLELRSRVLATQGIEIEAS